MSWSILPNWLTEAWIQLLAVLQSSNGLRQEDMCASSGSLAWPLCQHDPVGKIDISKFILWSFNLRLANHVTWTIEFMIRHKARSRSLQWWLVLFTFEFLVTVASPSSLLSESYRSIYFYDICLSDVWLTTTLSACVTPPQGWNSKAVTLARIYCIHVAVALCQDSFRYFYGVNQIYHLFTLFFQLQTDLWTNMLTNVWQEIL